MLKGGLVRFRQFLLPVEFVRQTLMALQAENGSASANGKSSWLDLLRFHHLLNEAAEREGGPSYGLHLADILYPRLFTRKEHLLMCADSVLAAVRTLQQHANAAGLVMRIQLEEGNESFHLVVDHRLQPPLRPVLVSEIVLGMFWRWISKCGPVRQDPVQVHISHPLIGTADRYHRFFGEDCQVHFDAERDSLQFSRRDFTRLNPRRDPELLARLVELVETDMWSSLQHLRQPRNQDWLCRIREEVSQQLERGHCSIETVATQLNLTPRTLQRRLKRYEMTFSVVLDECRRDRAIRILQSGAPRKAMATALGFDSDSALRRAFQRWFGSVTPRIPNSDVTTLEGERQ